MTSTGHHWRDQAACKGVDTELFYPEIKPGPPASSAFEDALAYCRACPVARECLSWAIKNDEHGIWGGQTPRQRSSADATRCSLPTVCDTFRNGRGADRG